MTAKTQGEKSHHKLSNVSSSRLLHTVPAQNIVQIQNTGLHSRQTIAVEIENMGSVHREQIPYETSVKRDHDIMRYTI